MADLGRNPESGAGEPDSSRSLWRAIKRLFEGEADQSLRAHLEDIIDEHEEDGEPSTATAGDLSPIERQMVRNVLHFSESDAGDVCIPRSGIIALPHNADWAQVVAGFAEHGHSRMPVFGESLDEIIGMIHVKDVFVIVAGMLLSGKAPPKDWTSLMRQPLFVPQARGALDVLADMRSSRIHLAVVVDEYSGTDGIITIEDLVEEIVGEIEDEYDEDGPDLLVQTGEGAWEADARTPLDEIAARVDPALAEGEGDVDTVGGLAFMLAGHVPEPGAELDHPSGWRITVVDGDDRRITRVRLNRVIEPAMGLGRDG